MFKKTSILQRIVNLILLMLFLVSMIGAWKQYDNHIKSLEAIKIIEPIKYLQNGTIHITLKNFSAIYAKNIAIKCQGFDTDDKVRGEFFISKNLFAKETRVFTFTEWRQKEYNLALRRVQKREKLTNIHDLNCWITSADMRW